MFSCLQILEAFLWFVLITLLNVTLIILTLSVSRLLNLLLRLVAFLLFLNPQCLASISRWITASSSWKRFLAAAFPELNAWERAGADASSAGMVDAGFENQKELTKMQLDNQKEIAEMQNETQKEIAGIQSATSRQNTKDQVYAQNEMLAYQQKESTAR